MVALEAMEQNLKRLKAAEGVSANAPHWTDAVVLLSDVIQTCFGYVCGCAWSDWLFETAPVLSANPTAGVIVTHLAIVSLITLFSCYWLAMNASSDGIDESLEMSEAEKKAKAEALATDRGAVEKQFFSGALGFFVLGGWLVVTRNLFAPFMKLIEECIGFADAKFGLSVNEATGDLIAVLLFAPIATVLAFCSRGA